MINRLIDQICTLIDAPRALMAVEKREVEIACEDTLVCALAGWFEPVTQNCIAALSGGSITLIDGSSTGTAEHAAFIHATAGHALDYDDVHLVSVTHPSVVIVPALLAMADQEPAARSRMALGFAIGVSVNVALGHALGFQHFDKGWHPTGTIGPLAGAAALAYMLQLDPAQTRSAIAIAAAQSGGLQRNFGTMAKPVQAGNAAAAAVRAAMLARAGVTGEQDIFGAKGVFDLYGVSQLDGPPLALDVGSLSRKLFPCCYASHRMIDAALNARTQLSVRPALEMATVRITVPYGNSRPLRVADPLDGAGAKFCGPYAVAVSLLDGAVNLSHFEDKAVDRADVRALMSRVEIIEDALVGEMPVGLDHGVTRLTLNRPGYPEIATTCVAYPGSPAAPITDQQLDDKLADCLARYNRQSNRALTIDAFRADVRRRLGVLDAAPREPEPA